MRTSWPVRILAMVVLVLGLGVIPTGLAQAATPDAVSLPGTLDSAAGCGGDWDPACPAVQMTRRASDDVWAITLDLPAGSYDYKVAIDKAWDENYGAGGVPGGGNISVVVATAPVTFYYDENTHWVTSTADAPIVTAAGSFQSELGCPGDWSPDCLRSWLQDPDGDGTYTFTTSALPAGDYQVKAALNLSWDVNYGAGGVAGGANIDFSVPYNGAKVVFSYVSSTHILTVSGTGPPSLKPLKAYWLSRNYLAWDPAVPATTFKLYAAPTGGLVAGADGITGGTAYDLTPDPAGLPASVKAKFPAQANLPALVLSGAGLAVESSLLTGQLAVAAFDAQGHLVDATGVQLPGVLDDRYAGAAHETLGLTWRHDVPTLALWAPTAKSVSVQIFSDAQAAASTTVPLHRDGNGVWSVAGGRSWKNKYYVFAVNVFVPETGAVEENLVTDPYSVGLSTNSRRSLLVDLSDPVTAPRGWNLLSWVKRLVDKPVDLSISELHIRDFSVADPTVPAAHRGTYLAFTDTSSNAVKRLDALSRSGLSTVHLLPAFDFATNSVNEDKSTWQSPNCNLASYPPDSDQQQACVAAVQATDGFNWGYDPMHYTTPEGSYATNADGAARTVQFRSMVQALNSHGLRVVMDVVYNHTADSGQNGTNDLDRIVPGYYHRLDSAGAVATSSCCPDTATEHTMMAKLMSDSVATWATQYKIDGFRFDLMSFTPKSVMVGIGQRLRQLTVARDGVDGRSIYLYGEGWNFGTAGNDALFVQATQANMAGTGIGTFNDRIRDGVRGGGPFDSDPRIQGFASGQYTDPNGDPVNGDAAAQKATLLHDEDLVKIGLVGNLKNFSLVNAAGATVTGAQIDYNGSPAGYTSQPQESINYVDAHDNETLYDALTYKLPQGTSMADRIRMQTIALATTAFSQGVSFWQAGSEVLRSRSFDSDSYNSGDWFNELDPSLTSNGFGKGLPIAAKNSAKWPYMLPLLADPALKPTHADLVAAQSASQTLLRIRATEPLLQLGSADAITKKVSFPNSGPSSTPGVIVLRIDDTVGSRCDRWSKGLVVIFNASPTATTQTVSGLAGQRFSLNRVQASGSDPVVRSSVYARGTGSFTVPGRTVAVFEQR